MTENNEIVFYANNTQKHSSEDPKNIHKYIRYHFSIENKTNDIGGYSGDVMFITLSDGRLIITNNLWFSKTCNRIPKNSLRGTIYNKRSDNQNVECYIYNRDKTLIKSGVFSCEKDCWFHMDEDKNN